VLFILPVEFILFLEFEQQTNSKEPAAAINAAHTMKGVMADIGGLALLGESVGRKSSRNTLALHSAYSRPPYLRSVKYLYSHGPLIIMTKLPSNQPRRWFLDTNQSRNMPSL